MGHSYRVWALEGLSHVNDAPQPCPLVFCLLAACFGWGVSYYGTLVPSGIHHRSRVPIVTPTGGLLRLVVPSTLFGYQEKN